MSTPDVDPVRDIALPLGVPFVFLVGLAVALVMAITASGADAQPAGVDAPPATQVQAPVE